MSFVLSPRRWVYSLIILTSIACSPVPEGIREQQRFVDQELAANPKVIVEQLEFDDFNLHFRRHGVAKQAVVVWIHGTPGSWTDAAYIIGSPSLTRDMMVYALDRPGWGRSVPKAKLENLASFEQQVFYIARWLKYLRAQHAKVPFIVIGHSWGASLLPSLIAEAEQIDGVLMLAGALDPSLAMPRWYNRFAASRAGAWGLSQFELGRMLLASNIEMYQLAPGLADSAQKLQQISVPTIVIQGQDDALVDPLNAQFARRYLNPKLSQVIEIKQQGHLLQIDSVDLIEQCIRALVNGRLEQCES